jgi:hypothetical protein
MTFQTTASRTKESARQGALLVLGTLLLLLTWLLLYVAMLSVTEGWLHAWSAVPLSLLPPLGAWHRTLMDSSDRLTAVWRQENLALGISLLLLAWRLIRGPHRAWTPLEFATLNLLFFVAFMVAGIFVLLLLELWASGPYTPPETGYQSFWPESIVETCLLFLLFAGQARGWLRKWLQAGGAVRGVIVGTPCGALLYASWALLVALLQGSQVLIGAVSGMAEGTVIGILVGAIAGAFSRLAVGLIAGALLGALIGWMPAEAPPWLLVGATTGIAVGLIVGGEKQPQTPRQ